MESFRDHLLEKLKDPKKAIEFVKQAIIWSEAAGVPDEPDIAYMLAALEWVLTAHGRFLRTD